jgi:hypothetical protein
MRLSQGKTNRITRQRVKQERGWTDSLMKDFLPDPVADVVNMHHMSGPRILLFDLRRIKRIEATKRFQKSLAATQPRKQAARKAVATKATKTQHFVEMAETNVEIIPMERLRRFACEWYNANHNEGDVSASPDGGDIKFLDRITVNYLRHQCSSYEPTLQQIDGHVGARDAYLSIKQNVLDAIAEAYPELAKECNRQASDAIH